MKNIKRKIIGLLIAFIISVIMSSVISNCLYLIFIRTPEEMVNLNVINICERIINIEDVKIMFLIIICAFMIFAFMTTFRLLSTKNYLSKTYRVTDNIEIPLPVGKNQTQHGSAWWLSKDKYKDNFAVNIVDPTNPTIASLLDFGKKLKKEVANNDNPNIDKVINNTDNDLEQVFKSGGIVVGKENKRKFKLYSKKIFGKISVPMISTRIIEKIYYIKDNLHSLTIGSTRSGKTRSVVIESMENLALAGESMIMSDPKR